MLIFALQDTSQVSTWYAGSLMKIGVGYRQMLDETGKLVHLVTNTLKLHKLTECICFSLRFKCIEKFNRSNNTSYMFSIVMQRQPPPKFFGAADCSACGN